MKRCHFAILAALIVSCPQAAVCDESLQLPPITIEELNAGGREAIRSWIDSFVDLDPTGEPVAVSRLNGSLILATLVYNEQGGVVIEDVLAESEILFRRTRTAGLSRYERSRLAANLGKAYEQLAGDRPRAFRWYLAALVRNREDEVAVDGVARLRRVHAVIKRKEAEGDRARELDVFFESVSSVTRSESETGSVTSQPWTSRADESDS